MKDFFQPENLKFSLVVAVKNTSVVFLWNTTIFAMPQSKEYNLAEESQIACGVQTDIRALLVKQYQFVSQVSYQNVFSHSPENFPDIFLNLVWEFSFSVSNRQSL